MCSHRAKLVLSAVAGVATLAGAATFATHRSVGSMSATAVAETVVLQPGAFEHPLPGEFLKDGHPVSAPRISIEIARPLEIMKYQVSATDYQRCVQAGACRPADASGQRDTPATGVSHIDAQAYAAWYSGFTGDSWRLPTDAEWGYAAAEKFTGDIEGGEANPANPAQRWLSLYRTESALDRRPDPVPRPRGTFGMNSKGVADIAGNVWEWTSTCYVHASVAADGQVVPGVDNCGVHVVEGFHRTYMSNFIRDGKSGGCAVGTPPDNLGFRLVREPQSLVGRAKSFFGLS